MKIQWTKTTDRFEFYTGSTESRFSAQIAQSTNVGKYMWMIFHEDSSHCVFGGEEDTVEAAKRRSSEWLASNAKPPAGSA
jgi:hypothetical protein